ncbi:MAG: hypothetical protein HYU39_01735 [Thaumarchaeota archaeon]|nr:hypothetical protein [Nitrososphaerota archaeon]
MKIGEDQIGIGESNLLYHLSCAPTDLLRDSITEANAIIAKGVTYFVNKYLPNELRAPSWPKKSKKILTDQELAAYTEIFARLIKDYRCESDRRKKKNRAP